MRRCQTVLFLFLTWVLAACGFDVESGDHLRQLQLKAITSGQADWGHWGVVPEKYSVWKSHSNRLIPVYLFGITWKDLPNSTSPYRDEDRLRELYGRLPENTLNPHADYHDQTDIYRLQQAAIAAGKKYVVLVVFDGMDWQTTQAASIHQLQQVAYAEGRGTGLAFQDYPAPRGDYGYIVTSPHNDGTKFDVNGQVVLNAGGVLKGGYDWMRAGDKPWSNPSEPTYLISQSVMGKQAYTDSSSSATSMTAGIKTYNDAINVDYLGQQVATIAHQLQERGFGIGVVTSVPISHATPAAAYAHNVNRDDFQDLTRDLLGLPSIAHRQAPLPGVDVLIGAGWGEKVLEKDLKIERTNQGDNYVHENRYLTDDDLRQIDVAQGGRYRVVQRTAGKSGKDILAEAARDAEQKQQRLFGYFGVDRGHLPFRTADGRFDPVKGVREAEKYSPADLRENPTLADMTEAALTVLSTNPKGFWLMIEAGDVDWANHDNNLDNSIGAVISGDDAFRTVITWIETHDAWKEAAVIVTADHGHYLVLEKPEALIAPKQGK